MITAMLVGAAVSAVLWLAGICLYYQGWQNGYDYAREELGPPIQEGEESEDEP